VAEGAWNGGFLDLDGQCRVRGWGGVGWENSHGESVDEVKGGESGSTQGMLGGSSLLINQCLIN
jgi:hypothetical protein